MRIAVRAGQTWSTKPAVPGVRTRYVRIVRVSKGQFPKATARQVTRTGNPRRSDYGIKNFSVWLTWDREQRAWTMPSGYRLE